MFTFTQSGNPKRSPEADSYPKHDPCPLIINARRPSLHTSRTSNRLLSDRSRLKVILPGLSSAIPWSYPPFPANVNRDVDRPYPPEIHDTSREADSIGGYQAFTPNSACAFYLLSFIRSLFSPVTLSTDTLYILCRKCTTEAANRSSSGPNSDPCPFYLSMWAEGRSDVLNPSGLGRCMSTRVQKGLIPPLSMNP